MFPPPRHVPPRRPYRGISTSPAHLYPRPSLSTELLLVSFRFGALRASDLQAESAYVILPHSDRPYPNRALKIPIKIHDNHLPLSHPNHFLVQINWRDPLAPHGCTGDTKIPARKTYSSPNPIIFCASFIYSAHRRCAFYGVSTFIPAQVKSSYP